ncbi:MAG: phytoene desaturase [Bacteroidales bacterium]|nr:phytoene desaturase [Bacteroidales bacterium]
MDKKRAVVVGAGIAGIASAIRLSVNGYNVTIFEKNSRPGGKISEFRADGFRFDTGPSLFTLPELVDELFTLCGKNPRDYFNYSALENSCRYHYPDGTKIISWTDRERFAGELQDKTGEPAENTLSFLDKCRELYELTANVFIFSAFSKMKNLMTEESKKVARNFRKLDAFSTMHGVIKRHFRDERVRQLFGRYATYNGSNPYKAPGTLNVIPHLEHNTGAWFPEKGMYSVVEALVKLAGEQGIAFVYNSYVKEILTEGDMVTGIVCSDGFHEADVVVSDSDIVPLYRKLMRRSIPLWYSSRDRSTSALIFYWGVEGSFPQFDLHNIFFSSDYPHEFRCMEKGLITADPTIYLFISSRKVISDAPAGCENWFVMINVPENRGQDWEKLIPEARKNIIARLTRETGIDIGSIIKNESILDPRLIEEKTLSHQGSLYGSSSNSMFSAFRRHPNHRNKYKNLLFTGGSVHPGGGIPLCLASARIAVDLLKDNQ